MPYSTISLGLTIEIPTPGTKNWGSYLTTNLWNKISEHDHTSGKGATITANAIATDAVTSAKINALAVTTAKLASNAVTTAKITDLNVTTAKIADSNITTAKIADSNITTAKIANDAINSAKILDANVTSAKLSADAATRSCYLLGAGMTSPQSGNYGALLSRMPGAGITRGAMPKAGKVTHLSLAISSDRSAGTATLTLYKNGITTGKSVVLGSGQTVAGSITAESFVASDYLEVHLQLSSFSPSVIGFGEAWGHFTE